MGEMLNLSVFHINCNLAFTPLYFGLLKSFSGFDITQTVWVPHKKYHNPEAPIKIENVTYFYTGYQDACDRFFFHRKIKKGMSVFEELGNIRADTVVHAHTLFSDGALAYEINLKYGTPYVVTIRNTDVNIFWKYFPHLRKLGRKIVQNASAVTFLSTTYKDKMASQLFPNSSVHNNDKIYVVPNGLDPFWLSHPQKIKKKSTEEIKVLFVGGFEKNKNINSVISLAPICKWFWTICLYRCDIRYVSALR